MQWIVSRVIFLPTLAWNVLLGRILGVRHWWDRIDEHLLMGALPFSSDAERLAGEGVTAVVNTCEEYAGPVRAYERLGIVQLRLPTIDFTPPSLESVERGVDFISAQIKQGGAVYVHCKAGRGRSATIVACWLMRDKGLSPAEAQAWLTRKRPHVNQHLDQRDVVQEYHRICQQSAAG